MSKSLAAAARLGGFAIHVAPMLLNGSLLRVGVVLHLGLTLATCT